jgi:predicted permease
VSVAAALRIAARTLVAWAAGAVAVLAVGFSLAREVPSREDLLGIIAMTLIGLILLAPLLYLPSLLWLRRVRRGRVEPAVFGVVAATMLNLPVLVLLAMGSLRNSFGAGEAFMLGAILTIGAGGFGWSVGRELRDSEPGR